jgi:hypothetical protein
VKTHVSIGKEKEHFDNQRAGESLRQQRTGVSSNALVTGERMLIQCRIQNPEKHKQLGQLVPTIY